MPVICIGPVCIPLNLLLPFLLGIAHRYGWLKWFKREWVTLAWWRQVFSSSKQPATGGAAAGAATAEGGISTDGSYVCEGGVCRLVPPDETAAAASKQADGQPAAAAAAGGGSVRHRKA
ncbi:hypothetical protein OEZ85_009751 [Tetradesmus obliquus]|uniref:Uncharacterized protein n=1 Tax=Tetradesmus obliquus TaxID=3088 RepID=A0ABY8UAF4_TETOB|nr:hypothetical protein OEZ85_009751 [Tetradesmus obliquus]